MTRRVHSRHVRHLRRQLPHTEGRRGRGTSNLQARVLRVHVRRISTRTMVLHSPTSRQFRYHVPLMSRFRSNTNQRQQRRLQQRHGTRVTFRRHFNNQVLQHTRRIRNITLLRCRAIFRGNRSIRGLLHRIGLVHSRRSNGTRFTISTLRGHRGTFHNFRIGYTNDFVTRRSFQLINRHAYSKCALFLPTQRT